MTVTYQDGSFRRLLQAKHTREGDRIVFANPQSDYTVDEVDTDHSGRIVHRWGDDTASCRYHPGEWLWVVRRWSASEGGRNGTGD